MKPDNNRYFILPKNFVKQTVCKQPRKTMVQGSLDQINKAGDFDSDTLRSALQSAMEEKLKKDFANTDTVGNVGQRVKNVAKDVGGDFFKNLGRTKKRSPGVASAIQFGKIVAPEKRIQDFKILNEKVEQYFNKYLEPKVQNPSEGSIPLYFNLPTLPQGNLYYL